MGHHDRTNLVIATDEFRKSRRNSLWWSALVVLVSIGVSKDHGLLLGSPAIFPGGFQFTKEFIVISSTSVSIFSFLGFYRNKKIIDLLNSEYFRSNNIESIDSKIISLEGNISDFFSKSNEALKYISNLELKYREIFSNFIETSSRRMASSISQIGNEANELPFTRLSGDDDRQSVEYWKQSCATLQQRFRQGISSIHESQKDISDEYTAAVNDALKALRSDFQSIINDMSNRSGEVSDISTSIRLPYSKLDKFDKNWHKYYDIYAVHVMFISSFCLSMNYLISSFSNM